MTPIKGLLDPQARAALDVVLANWAAPGMCNPETETPRLDDEASESVAERDTRSAVQRNHEALNTGCEVVHG
jgi:Domain of unknown function (DUF222)